MHFKPFKFKEAITLFSYSFFVLLFSFFTIRLLEFCWFQFVLEQHVPWHLFLSKSVNLDLLYLGFISIPGCILFFILNIIHRKTSVWFTVFWGSLLVLAQIVLTHFHLTNQTLLSSVVFQFSIQELLDIAFAEFTSSQAFILTLWGSILFMTIYALVRIPKLNVNKIYTPVVYTLFLCLLANSVLNIEYAYKPVHRFKSVRPYLFSNSKPLFLYNSFNALKNDNLITYNEVKKDLEDYQNSNQQKKYLNIEYPLVYRANAENVLGSFFKSSETPPDIVLIISESLSSSFSGAATGLNGVSLTPFTDSLAANGLYWSNFLSNAPRSFGVLPNILSSLPPSKKKRGIINIIDDKHQIEYPDHQSIVSILNANNYHTSHFYPGWSGFDHTKYYMQSLGTDDLIDQADFDSLDYTRYGRWGFSDYELYKKGLNYLDHVNDSIPKLAIFQTIACHSPFDMVAPKYYNDKYLDSKKKGLHLTALEEKQLSKFTKAQLSTIFASDDALKYLFNRIKSSGNFDNTIFIITGDHSLGRNLSKSVLDKFHVPLIVYSPLLTRSKTIKGVCSHIDIAPSLLALLKENYNIHLNENAHWLGQGLDTSSVYVSNNTFPLEIDGIIRPNYIHKNHIIFGDKVYRLQDDFNITPEQNTNQSLLVKENFETFKKLNLYTTENNKIWSANF